MQKAVETVGRGLALLMVVLIGTGLILLTAVGLIWTVAWLLVNMPW